MTTTPIFTGIDLQNNQATIVKLRTDSGRSEVVTWETVEVINLTDYLIEYSNAHIALPDRLINIHTVNMTYPHGVDITSAVAFEIRESILCDSDEYLIDVISGKDHNHHVGLIIRRQQLEDFLLQEYDLSHKDIQQLRFSSRLVAQVRGWLDFCHSTNGEFVAYLDISDRYISVALVYHCSIVDLFVLPFQLSKTISTDEISHILPELKTLLDFHLASLFDSGINLPLISVVISGGNLSDAVIAIIAEELDITVERPKMNLGYFNQTEKPTQAHTSSILSALGLASFSACLSDSGNVS